MKNKIFIGIGFCLVIISLILTVMSIYTSYSDNLKEDNIINDYINQTSNFDDYLEESSTVIKNEEISDDKKILLILEIPKINLKKGIYYINSKYNSVSYNVEILKESNMPDEVNGNLFLASHRGNSGVSYFDKLYKLNENDEVYIYYKGIKYIYKIDHIYNIEKDGTAEIYRDENQTTITLITCIKELKDKQQVFIGYLHDTVNY